MKKKQFLAAGLCAAMALSLLAGCGTAAEAGGAATGEASGEAGSAGSKKITYSVSADPETLDPGQNNYARSSIFLQNLFHGLYKFAEDGQVVPSLAEGYDVDETGLHYTFHLRKDLKWSDGTPLTAHDFEYSWKRTLSPELASKGADYLYYVKNGEAYNQGEATADDVGVKATDDTTLEVELENPTAYFVDLTTSSTYFPVKQETVESPDTWTKSADTYVCNGPFMLKEIKPQDKYVMVKNPNYVEAGTVKLDEVDFVVIETSESVLAAYTNNELDVDDNLSTQALTQYKDSGELKTSDRIGTYYLDINNEHEPFNDPRVRKALAMTIDRNLLINNVIQCDYKPAYGFVPYGIPDITDTTKSYRDVTGDLFSEDTEAAKQLLSDAGYPGGEGFPAFTYITFNNALDTDIAQALQSMWKEKLGIQMEIVTYESKVYWDEIEKGNFDVARDGWTGDYPDPMTNLDLFMLNTTGDDCRWTGEKANQYDALLQANLASVDQTERMSNFQEAEKILMDDMPIIPVYYMTTQYLVKPNITGVTKNIIGHTLFEYADVT